MTVKEAIGLVDALAPNSLDDGIKIKWLGDLELVIRRDIHELHEGIAQGAFVPLGPGSSLETVLAVGAPYDEIYRYYLEMKIWEVLGEIERYNNAAVQYKNAMIGYMDYVNRNYRPKGLGNIKIL